MLRIYSWRRRRRHVRWFAAEAKRHRHDHLPSVRGFVLERVKLWGAGLMLFNVYASPVNARGVAVMQIKGAARITRS